MRATAYDSIANLAGMPAFSTAECDASYWLNVNRSKGINPADYPRGAIFENDSGQHAFIVLGCEDMPDDVQLNGSTLLVWYLSPQPDERPARLFADPANYAKLRRVSELSSRYRNPPALSLLAKLQHTALPTPECLADEFSRRLTAGLGPCSMAIARRMQHESKGDYRINDDFPDANLLLEAARAHLVGRPALTADDVRHGICTEEQRAAEGYLWRQAWDIAHENCFCPAEEEPEESANIMRPRS